MMNGPTTVFGIRVPHELKESLTQLAVETGEKRNVLINIALREFIQTKYPEFLINS